MKILGDVYQNICNSVSDTPPETGGILGGSNNVVTEYSLDNGVESGSQCSYTPNVEKLNKVIAEWQNQRIEFMGIYHTHYFGVSTLSDADKQYILAIMQAMPDYVKELYFPLVVMPQREMIVYKATYIKERLTI